MSTIAPPSIAPQSGSTPPPSLSYEPRPYWAPKAPWTQRFNWRIFVFAAVIIVPIGFVFGMWVNEVRSNGIYNRGDFLEVNLKAMSTFDMDQHNAVQTDIPAPFRALEGKKVMMIGEMWAPQSAGAGLGYFQLVYSKTKCCFSGPPLAQHFVDGNVVPGKLVYYYDVPVKVWGTLHVSISKDKDGVIKSVYHVDVDKVEPIES